jgi:hypothetical protein
MFELTGLEVTVDCEWMDDVLMYNRCFVRFSAELVADSCKASTQEYV